MNTYKEIVYMILDEIKAVSDDSYFEEEHIVFLMKSWRATLLGQRYGDVKRSIPIENFQTICLNLEPTLEPFSPQCQNGYLRTIETIPSVLKLGANIVHPMDMFSGDIALISFDRFKYTGYNKFLKNVIYATIAPDSKLYLKSENPQYYHMEQVKFTAMFSDPEQAYSLRCDQEQEEGDCELLETMFPLEARLIPNLIQVVVKELLGASYRPQDSNNNAKDDMSEMANFLSSITNRNFQRSITGQEDE